MQHDRKLMAGLLAAEWICTALSWHPRPPDGVTADGDQLPGLLAFLFSLSFIVVAARYVKRAATTGGRRAAGYIAILLFAVVIPLSSSALFDAFMPADIRQWVQQRQMLHKVEDGKPELPPQKN